jgi:membrane associated rhomboid family serine protease
MGVADRYYMRDEYHPPRVTTKLIITLIVAFVIQSVLQFYGDLDVYQHLALSVHGLKHGKIWQLVTFQFLHSVPMPWHVLFNCLGLYFFGRRVEESLGGKKFLGLYLLAGVAGGLLQVLLTILLPRHDDFGVVGASAGVSGIIAIFCSMHPMEELRAWVYFFPVNIRAYWLLVFMGCLSLYGALVPFDHVAHGAHLGGILLGIGYVRWRHVLSERFSGLIPWLGRTRGRPRPGSLARNSPWKRERAKAARESQVFVSKEVDPILDKISAHGIDSLTDAEREILDRAQKKLR